MFLNKKIKPSLVLILVLIAKERLWFLNSAGSYKKMSVWGFHILATRNNNFSSIWEVPISLGGPFDSIQGENGLFWDKLLQNSKFASFLRIFYHQQDFETSYTVKEISLTNKNIQRGCLKSSNMAILDKKTSFLTKMPVKFQRTVAETQILA